jgi:hypothetical protein
MLQLLGFSRHVPLTPAFHMLPSGLRVGFEVASEWSLRHSTVV